MPLTRQQKEKRVTQLANDLAGATATVFLTYDGLTVADANALRRQLHEQRGHLRVMGKRLLRLVCQQVKLGLDPTTWVGQVAVAWGADPLAPAKVIHAFTTTRPHVTIVAGTLDGQLLKSENVLALAQLPSRDQLLQRLVSTIAAPMRGWLAVLTGAQRALVYALGAIGAAKT